MGGQILVQQSEFIASVHPHVQLHFNGGCLMHTLWYNDPNSYWKYLLVCKTDGSQTCCSHGCDNSCHDVSDVTTGEGEDLAILTKDG